MSEFVFEVVINTHSTGWADLVIEAGSHRAKVLCSYVFDSLGEIIRGLAQLAAQEGKFEVECDSENQGIFLLIFRRTGEKFHLTAKRSIAGFDKEEARHQRARIRFQGPWLISVQIIVTAFDHILEKYGLDGYKDRWGHEFPKVAWDQLKTMMPEHE